MNKLSCAERIRTALKLRDLTQADLCRITGIPKSAMSQYCNGTLVPRQNRTRAIAAALGVSEAWIMGFDVPMEEKPATETGDELDATTRELLNLAATLDPVDVHMLLDMAKAIKARRKEE